MPHTPGPWKVMGTEDEGFTIAPCDEQGNPEEPIVWRQGGIDYRPNAVLMAAAPDLLAACELAIEEQSIGMYGAISNECIAALRAAIAKAVEPEPPELPFYDK